ncbi:MAG TPA: O-antigen ligase family protein [Longimicrobiales bacterium]
MTPRRTDSIARWLLGIAAAAIPFETYVYLDVGFTLKIPQVCALVLVVIGTQSQRHKARHLEFALVLTAFLTAAALSLLPLAWSPGTGESLWGGRQTGLMSFYNLAFLVLIAFATALNAKDFRAWRALILGLLVGASLAVFVEFYRYYLFIQGKIPASDLWWLPSGIPRLTPRGMAANQFAATLLAAAGFGVFFLAAFRDRLSRAERLLFSGCIPVVLIGLLATFSRGPTLGFVLACTLGIAYFALWQPRAVFRILSVTTLVLGLLLVAGELAPLPFDPAEAVARRIGSALQLSRTRDASWAERLGFWENSLEAFASSPILGRGLSTNLTPHNVPLQVLSEAGVVGFATFALLSCFVVMSALLAIWKTDGGERHFLAGSLFVLAGYSLYLMVDIGLFQIQTWMYAGFIVGVAIHAPHGALAADAPPLPPALEGSGTDGR